MSTDERVITYGPGLDRTRMTVVELDNVRVRFEPRHVDDNDDAASMASAFQTQGDRQAVNVARANAERDAAEKMLAECRQTIGRLRAQLPPESPLRFFGPCYVRFDPAGKGVWLMNKQAAGWSSSGFRYDSWDEVFRRFDAHVTSHGTDEHGAFWILENRTQAAGRSAL